MITPITRKELYLAKIIGEDVDIPETAKTREELFFLKILDNFSKIPEPITREELFLAKISGQDVELPEPKTRLELFLAKAAGVEIETPTPITREEIFWSNYSAIIDFELEGIPPLTYKAVKGTLKNYRIYGNTVSGESVGDLVESGENAEKYKVPVTVEGKNLLQNIATSQTINGVTFIVNSDGSITCNGTAIATAFFTINSSIDVEEGYIINGCPDVNGDAILRIANNATDYYVEDKGHGGIIDSRTSGNTKIIIRVSASYTCNNLTFYPMIRKADIEDDTYEPYHAPVTTPIYLSEQIRKVGDEAEYIDYGEQKQHFADGTSVDVTLPALPTLSGTNTLTAGTEVQPSNVYIKYKGAR